MNLIATEEVPVRLSAFAFACCLLAPPALAADAANTVERGTVRFTPVGDQKEVPERYRLGARSFDYEMDLKCRLPSGVTVYRLRFPSPLPCPHPENNTVHAEYYRPAGEGPFSGVIILDITAGDQSLSRVIATHLARQGVAGLFVQMAYYGPRRPPGSSLRLLSPDVAQTMTAIRQTVLDLRCAAAWMAGRPELDAGRLGILGTSLGSFLATLTAEMEPRLGRVANLLGGGGLVDAYWDDPRGAEIRAVYEKLGGTKEGLRRLIAPADPITCAANLRSRRLLILAARRDEIVPPRMAEALWEAAGRQKIVWYDCTHYGAALHLPAALREIVEHFRAD
jgi:dienelactone hydrolase